MTRIFAAASMVCLALAATGALWLYAYYARSLPRIPPFHELRFGTVSTVRASHGQLLSEVFKERRYLVAPGIIPKVLAKAFVASEDQRFFEHTGLDVWGILRAAWADISAMRIRQGGSTITQQLARMLLLGREKTLERKVKEAILARRIEETYTKEQILNLYMNLVYLGSGYYGVEAAARGYFGKSLDSLTLEEAVTIAALPRSPSRVNPFVDPQGTVAGRNRVLRRMAEVGFITRQQAAAAMKAPLRTVPQRDDFADRAPSPTTECLGAVAGMLRKYATGNPLEGTGGVTVVSTIDLGVQLLAQKALWAGASELSRRQGFRGPIARLGRGQWERFLKQNLGYLKAHRAYPLARLDSTTPILALVTSAEKGLVSIAITPSDTGEIPLSNMKYASPYREFRVRRNGHEERRVPGRVSFKDRLKDARKVLRPGDVILVTKQPLDKKPRKGRKGAGRPKYSLAMLPEPQGALFAVDPLTGYTLASIGSTDFDLSQYDRTTALRQTGSAVKPLYYSMALDLGVSSSAYLLGTPVVQGRWDPTRGRMDKDSCLFDALAHSRNNPSLRVFRAVLEMAGVDQLNAWARSLGTGIRFQGFLAEGLGVDATLRDLVSVMQVFAGSGRVTRARLIKMVLDSEGKLITDNRSPYDPMVGMLDALVLLTRGGQERMAISREVAYLMAWNLRGVVARGTARRARSLPVPAFGKTGTLPFDVWFVGFVPGLVTGVWIGEDQRQRYLGRWKWGSGVTASNTALPVWIDFVSNVQSHDRRKSIDPDPLERVPEAIVFAKVDPQTCMLSVSGGIDVPHLRGTEPDASYPPTPPDELMAAF